MRAGAILHICVSLLAGLRAATDSVPDDAHAQSRTATSVPEHHTPGDDAAQRVRYSGSATSRGTTTAARDHPVEPRRGPLNDELLARTAIAPITDEEYQLELASKKAHGFIRHVAFGHTWRQHEWGPNVSRNVDYHGL